MSLRVEIPKVHFADVSRIEDLIERLELRRNAIEPYGWGKVKRALLADRIQKLSEKMVYVSLSSSPNGVGIVRVVTPYHTSPLQELEGEIEQILVMANSSEEGQTPEPAEEVLHPLPLLADSASESSLLGR